MTRIQGGITAPKGFQATGVEIGLKKSGYDLVLIYSPQPALGAGVFTKNKVAAAPIHVSRENVKQGAIQAFIINSGNANACTGQQGLEDAGEMADLTARALGIPPEHVLVASTGVIGQELPMERIRAGIPEAVARLSPRGGDLAARGIMTTDTHPKVSAVELDLGGQKVTIGGIAKGSGMIHPNMATMLAFFTTDCAISQPLLQKALTAVVNKTFNRITVDGDTSTNDMAVIMANGQGGNTLIDAENDDFQRFQAGLEEVALDLAQAIVRDGEGATKLIIITVQGAQDERTAVTVAKAIAGSNLVKTAIYGCDANWGRIICAAGYSGADLRPELIDIYLGDEQVAHQGAGLPFDEAKAKRILEQDEIQITVNLNEGQSQATVWTCDLTYDYIKINASYRS